MARKSKFKKKAEAVYAKTVNKLLNSVAQEENEVSGEKYITPGMPEQVRKLAEEGIVLLKNDNKVLPITEDKCVSVFGRIQYDWFYVGYGSGGDVHAPYKISLFEGFDNAGINYNKNLRKVYEDWCQESDNEASHGFWGHWPYFHEEMPLTSEQVSVAKAASDVAIVIIGRAAGEDRENKLEQGSYYITDEEHDMMRKVCKEFEHVILVMDCGNIIDMSFVDEYNFEGIVYAWQLGQENGNALANVLSGKVNPSGRLSDTIAINYEDYPSASSFGKKEFNNYFEDIYVGYRYFETFAKEKVKYPFGYGLSYTTFDIITDSVVRNASDDGFEFNIRVKNTGDVAGKEVVQIYVSAPEGKLKKPTLVLAAYDKTEIIQHGADVDLSIEVFDHDIASFDDCGITGFEDSFVLEAGKYIYKVGANVRDARDVFDNEIDENICVEKCNKVMSPKETFGVLDSIDPKTNMFRRGSVTVADTKLRERILDNLPTEIQQTEDKGIKLIDVKNGKNTLEEFIAQLSDKDLSDISRGEGMMGSTLGTEGNAGVFGGITPELRDKGIPPLVTADGPAGLRLKRYATLLPCGTAIACTWNHKLIEETFVLIGKEGRHYEVDVNLSPGMNIHRNPLCGRNFEYYSEDPMLSGRVAAATVRGIQQGGISACAKHFACNNQEYNRTHNDSRVSMRALREIYLKNFEYCVKESNPDNIMTSYNKVNGVWSHYNYELVTTVLRDEWGYEGNVMTDWWMRKAAMPEFPKIKNNAYRVRAQVDVYMPGNLNYLKKTYVYDSEILDTLNKPDGLTRAELQRTAANVLRYAMSRMD
ncbi:MAG: glycoside hydrolase family 3 C-terminal domain-containing protein [Lachnospiraceae bacterium]|nr:glycoside hydrolase family 3 C-terminal domain-containing protein [Lachnospiraceae bacterium]